MGQRMYLGNPFKSRSKRKKQKLENIFTKKGLIQAVGFAVSERNNRENKEQEIMKEENITKKSQS
jgi:hypothetical protein